MCSLNNWLGWILLAPFQVFSIIKSGSQFEMELFCLLSSPQAASDYIYQGILTSTCGLQVQPQPHNRSFLVEVKLQKKILVHTESFKKVDFNKTLFWLQKSRLSPSGSVRHNRHSRDQMWPSRKISTDPIAMFGFHVFRLKAWPLQPVRLALQSLVAPCWTSHRSLLSECCLRAAPVIMPFLIIDFSNGYCGSRKRQSVWREVVSLKSWRRKRFEISPMKKRQVQLEMSSMEKQNITSLTSLRLFFFFLTLSETAAHCSKKQLQDYFWWRVPPGR